MPSRADVNALRSIHGDVVTLATRDLNAFWASLNLDNPEQARDQLLAFVPHLVALYGDIAATVAADWYDELRDSSPDARGNYRAQPADSVDAERVGERVRFSAGHLFGEHPFATLSFLSVIVSEYVLAPSRWTVANNAATERVLWARVTGSAKPCAFCLRLSAAGYVYGSAHAAGDRNAYHGKCSCIAVPDWSDNPHLDGYDPDRLSEQIDAAQHAEPGKDELAALRAHDDLA